MRNLKVGLSLLSVGLFSLFRILIINNPRLDTLHDADFVFLIGTGFFLGGGVVTLLLLIRQREPASH
jgi:hypothetical protein